MSVLSTTRSADGTVIAYERTGDGPPLVVAVGAFCTRHTFVAPPELAANFAVYTYDRRGRGDSGDTQPFSAEREYEDLAAVAAVAEAAYGSGRPFVFGHSSGAAIALRAVARGVPLAAVVAYEAPFGNADTPAYSVADPAAHIRALVASGRRNEAVVFWMREVARLSADRIDQMEGAQWVKDLEPLVPALVYDLAVCDGGVPSGELAAINVPVLILGGRNSADWFHRSVADQASATPGAKLTMIDGYDHNAPPGVITPIITEFFTESFPAK